MAATLRLETPAPGAEGSAESMSSMLGQILAIGSTAEAQLARGSYQSRYCLGRPVPRTRGGRGGEPGEEEHGLQADGADPAGFQTAPLRAGEVNWTTRLEGVLDWARSRSITPLTLVAGCCASVGIEDGLGPRHDLEEFSGALPRYAPAHADLLIVAGPIRRSRAAVIQGVYAEMADPKWVVAYGACACTGGAYDNYSTTPGLAAVVPVDIFIPGCPPRSEALLDGLDKLRARIRSGAHGGRG